MLSESASTARVLRLTLPYHSRALLILARHTHVTSSVVAIWLLCEQSNRSLCSVYVLLYVYELLALYDLLLTTCRSIVMLERQEQTSDTTIVFDNLFVLSIF